MTVDEASRAAKTKTLIAVVAFDALVIALVVAGFLITGSMLFLIGGVVAISLVTTPIILRAAMDVAAKNQQDNAS